MRSSVLQGAEIVASGLEFPEGPIAMDDGSIILVEIKGQRVSRVRPTGGLHR